MKTKLFLAFVAVLFAATFASCDKADESNGCEFTFNGMVVEAGKTLNPNDLIHITSEDFESGDKIALALHWNTDDSKIPETTVTPYYPEVVEQTANSIAVRMPYRFPAGRAEVMVARGGKFSTIGEVKTTSGETPQEPAIFGVYTKQEKYGLSTDDSPFIATIAEDSKLGNWILGDHTDFHSCVNASQTYGLCGLSKSDGVQKPYFFDFCTAKWKELNVSETIALFQNAGDVWGIVKYGDNLYGAAMLSDQLDHGYYAETRASDNAIPQQFKIPEEIKGLPLDKFPGAMANKKEYVLLSAEKGNGTWIPVVYSINSGFQVLAPIECEALIPFSFIKGDGAELVGGYAIVDSTGSKFCLFDFDNASIGSTFATFSNKAMSVTSWSANADKFTVLFLAYRNGNIIETYDWNTKEWTWEGGMGFSPDEIVWAN